MPELPEVETLRCYLNLRLVNLAINELVKTRDRLRYTLSNQLEANVKGGKIIGCRRRAKYLLIDLDNGYSIIIHLGMSGRLTLQDNNYIIKKHDHLIFYLNNSQILVFNDPRRFGMLYTMPTSSIEKQFFSRLGVEPLSANISLEYLKNKLLNRNRPIKNLLMDNHIIVGIGNIYASESLFQAQIHPVVPGHSLASAEINRLILAIQNVLAQAIKAGGTTLKDFVSGDNKPGYFQQQLQVYGRQNQPCRSCNTIIEKIQQAGRATFYCPTCQKR